MKELGKWTSLLGWPMGRLTVDLDIGITAGTRFYWRIGLDWIIEHWISLDH